MSENLTVAELNVRWEKALTATHTAVARHPDVYCELKSLAEGIIDNPLDIKEYLPTTEKLVDMLNTLDPGRQGSIFHHFNDRVLPSSIWHVPLLRMECTDLLAHLKVFDEWRLKTRRLELVK